LDSALADTEGKLTTATEENAQLQAQLKAQNVKSDSDSEKFFSPRSRESAPEKKDGSKDSMVKKLEKSLIAEQRKNFELLQKLEEYEVQQQKLELLETKCNEINEEFNNREEQLISREQLVAQLRKNLHKKSKALKLKEPHLQDWEASLDQKQQQLEEQAAVIEKQRKINEKNARVINQAAIIYNAHSQLLNEEQQSLEGKVNQSVAKYKAVKHIAKQRLTEMHRHLRKANVYHFSGKAEDAPDLDLEGLDTSTTAASEPDQIPVIQLHTDDLDQEKQNSNVEAVVEHEEDHLEDENEQPNKNTARAKHNTKRTKRKKHKKKERGPPAPTGREHQVELNSKETQPNNQNDEINSDPPESSSQDVEVRTSDVSEVASSSSLVIDTNISDSNERNMDSSKSKSRSSKHDEDDEKSKSKEENKQSKGLEESGSQAGSKQEKQRDNSPAHGEEKEEKQNESEDKIEISISSSKSKSDASREKVKKKGHEDAGGVSDPSDDDSSFSLPKPPSSRGPTYVNLRAKDLEDKHAKKDNLSRSSLSSSSFTSLW